MLRQANTTNKNTMEKQTRRNWADIGLVKE
jgi:hypothetical protein